MSLLRTGHEISKIWRIAFSTRTSPAWSWLLLCDVENSGSRCRRPPCPARHDAVPLYYAVLCGFHDFSRRLLDLDARPQDVNPWGGYYYMPLLAAFKQGASKNCASPSGAWCRRGISWPPSLGCNICVASSRGYTEVLSGIDERGKCLLCPAVTAVARRI